MPNPRCSRCSNLPGRNNKVERATLSVARSTLALPAQLWLQFVRKHLFKLIQFRPDDRGTIRLPGMVHIVILMVVFRRVECGEWDDVGDNGAIEGARGIEFLLVTLSQFLLIGIVVENDRAILRAHVVALAVARRWVVSAPKDFE